MRVGARAEWQPDSNGRSNTHHEHPCAPPTPLIVHSAGRAQPRAAFATSPLAGTECGRTAAARMRQSETGSEGSLPDYRSATAAGPTSGHLSAQIPGGQGKGQWCGGGARARARTCVMLYSCCLRMYSGVCSAHDKVSSSPLLASSPLDSSRTVMVAPRPAITSTLQLVCFTVGVSPSCGKKLLLTTSSIRRKVRPLAIPRRCINNARTIQSPAPWLAAVRCGGESRGCQRSSRRPFRFTTTPAAIYTRYPHLTSTPTSRV
jgi:hypothetical protein